MSSFISSGETSTTTDHCSGSTPDATSFSALLESVLPSTIEKQFAIIEQSVCELGRALHELKQLCPHIQSTPRIRTLAERVEHYRTEVREDCRGIRTRLRVPFTIIETQFDDEYKEAMQAGIVKARLKDGPTFLCGEAALVNRGREPPLERSLPFALSVKHSCDGDYQNWRIPYKLVFTPDSSQMDAAGKPFPSVSVAVDNSGTVQCAWRRVELDEENKTVAYLDEELLQCKSNPTLVKLRFKPMTIQGINGPDAELSGAPAS